MTTEKTEQRKTARTRVMRRAFRLVSRTQEELESRTTLVDEVIGLIREYVGCERKSAYINASLFIKLNGARDIVVHNEGDEKLNDIDACVEACLMQVPMKLRAAVNYVNHKQDEEDSLA